MKRTLVKNIRSLFQAGIQMPSVRKGSEMALVPSIENAFLMTEGEKVMSFGSMKNCPERADLEIDAKGGLLFPCFPDSHTHVVFAKNRDIEFVDRIKGLSYEEIARRGGGILNSARELAEMPEDQLFEDALARIYGLIKKGTGAIEIKSGYGLSTDAEIKMLRVIRRLKEALPIPVKASFLGAHALPLAYKENREGYIKLITDEMLPKIADEGLADYCDVFCDRGFFTVDETTKILEAAAKYGIKPKIHANELDFSGGIQVGVKNQAVSVDHLEFTGKDEIDSLLNSDTMPTLLPSTAFFLGLEYPPARKMIDAGLPVSLASDFNPGSSPSGDLSFIFSLACLKLKMLPEEVLNALTVNAAAAMELQDSHGFLKPKGNANFIISKPMNGLNSFAYHFTDQRIEHVFIKGKEF